MKLVAIWLIALYLRHSNAGFTTFVRKIFHRSTKSIRTTSKLTGLSNITSSYEENLVVTLESKNSELFEEVVHLRHLTQKQKKLIQTLKVESSKSKRKIVEIEESHKIELKALANKLESDFELRKQRYLKSLKSEFGNKFKDQIKELKASHKLELEEIKKELAEASEVSTSSESKRQKEIEKLELKLEKSQEQIKELLQLKESKKQSGKQHEEIDVLKANLRQLSLSTANNTDTTSATTVPSTSATEQVSPLPHNTQSLSSSPAPVAKAIVSEDIKGRDCDEETTSTVESKRVEVEHKTSCQSSSKSNSKGRSRSNKMQRGIIKSAGKKSSNSKSRK